MSVTWLFTKLFWKNTSRFKLGGALELLNFITTFHNSVQEITQFRFKKQLSSGLDASNLINFVWILWKNVPSPAQQPKGLQISMESRVQRRGHPLFISAVAVSPGRFLKNLDETIFGCSTKSFEKAVIIETVNAMRIMFICAKCFLFVWNLFQRLIYDWMLSKIIGNNSNLIKKLFSAHTIKIVRGIRHITDAKTVFVTPGRK